GEGLIEPERTASGYRKFYDRDVDRLRSILKMQRDEYLPLKVIKDRLDQGDDLSQPQPSVQTEEQPPDEVTLPPMGLHMSVDELSAATGVDRERIRELEGFGIICSHGLNGDQYYDGDDFVVLTIVRDLFKYGIEPRHLTMYRHFAEREASFFEQIVLPMIRQRNPDARRAATESLTQMANLSKKLKQALLRVNLRQYLQV
ncbi:MAG TPA: MerR family transcriptional regulator, partial [Actinomycetota bacterium]|nr:MerR family transcriptional regulator [Actinomycetota bacterium]